MKALTGNQASAEALRQINPDVVAAYPITPTTSIMEYFAKFVADGRVQTEFVPCESEHGALSVCIGAAAAGGRVATATASQGLLLMSEALFNASGMRLPMVLVNGCRAISAPLNIHGDHSDAYAVRDSGWIMLFAQNQQEAYDLTLQAVKISEHPTVRTPVMVCIDGFLNTHTLGNIQIEDDSAVKKFLGEYLAINPLLDLDHPVSYGAANKPDFYTEHRRSQLEGFLNAPKIISEAGSEFQKTFGRDYAQPLSEYFLKDAEVAIVGLGSLMNTVMAEVDCQRAAKKKVGALSLRSFRPFPADAIRQALAGKKAIAVLDRSSPIGAELAPLATEIRSALATLPKRPKILPIIAGLGGRDVFTDEIAEIFQTLGKLKSDAETRWLGLE
jgi:pyruvate ferredoxin oxidoreductase alpha subunit